MHSSQVVEEGLGKAVAIALANEGVNVGITGRNEEHLKSTVAELEKLGVKAVYSVLMWKKWLR